MTGFVKKVLSHSLLGCIVLCLAALPLMNAAKTSPKCGIRNVGGVEGENGHGSSNMDESDFGEFPWTVDITKPAATQQHLCTGSLIHSKVVLTTGHCIQHGGEPGELKIRAGLWDRNNTNNQRLPYQERSVEKTIIHPEISRFRNDFGLIILTEPFTLDTHINTICLPPANHVTPNGTECYASGWEHPLASGKLKRVAVSTLDLETCEHAFAQVLRGRKTFDNSIICAIDQNDSDSCRYHSGSPMVCRIGPGTNEQYQQIGITSVGVTSCFERFPVGFSHVVNARAWIDAQMAANGLETSSYSI